MIPLGPVVARSRLRAERTAAWTYLADADRRAEWWPELRLVPRVGGEISERWSEETVSRDASGKIDVWVDGHAIGFTWREAGDLRDTAVLLTLRSQGTETGITVTETGFDALPNGAERAAGSHEGWQVLLRDLNLAVAAAADAGVFGVAVEPADSGPVSAEPVSAEPVSAESFSAEPVASERTDAVKADADARAADPASAAGAPEDVAAEPAGSADRGDAARAGEVGAPSGDVSDGFADDLNDTVRVERLPAAGAPGPDAAPTDAAPLVAAAPEAQPAPAASAPEQAPAAHERTEYPADLDFDALIRGDHPDTNAR